MKKSLRILSLVLALVLAFSSMPYTAYAKSVLKQGSANVDFDTDFDEYSFKLKNDGVICVELETETDKSYRYFSNGKDGIKVILFDEDDKKVYSAKFRIDKGYSDEEFWFWPDEELYEGRYYLTFESLTDCPIKCTYKVIYYKNFATSLKVPKKINVKTNHTKSVPIKGISPKNSLHGADIKIDNKKLAEVYFDRENKFYIYGKKAGKCNLTVKLENGKIYKSKVIIKNPKPELNYTDVSLYYGEKEQLKVNFTKKKAKWSTSNKKVAVVNKNGKVTAKGKGNCVITAKCGKRKYKAKVKVSHKEPDFVAIITDYNTRNNYFTVKVKNCDSKSLTICSNKAYCMQDDYKVYDRKLRLPKNKNITIKGYKIKKIRFYVKGSVTWYDSDSYRIRFNFRFNGKKYLASIRSEDSSFKKGKSWYDTYWNNCDLYDLRGYD